MGAATSQCQCCTACHERHQDEFVEASPANAQRPPSTPYPGVEAPQPCVDEPVRTGRSDRGATAASSTSAATAAASGSAAIARTAGGLSSGAFGVPLEADLPGNVRKFSDGSAGKTRTSSEATLSPRSVLTARWQAVLPAAPPPPQEEPAAQELTDDTTEEPTLEPREELILASAIEVPAVAAAQAAEPPPGSEASPALPVENAVEQQAKECAAEPAEASAEPQQEEPSTQPVDAGTDLRLEEPATEPVDAGTEPRPEEDPLREAIDGGDCKLQVEFVSPRKDLPQQEAVTPPTAVPESPVVATPLTAVPETPVARGETTEPADVEAESWSDFLERSAMRLREAGISDEAPALFDVFQTTDDLGLTYASFARLYAMATADKDAAIAGQPPWAGPAEAPGRSWRFPYQIIQKLLGNNWKAQKLWRLLNDRTGRPEYAEAPCGCGRLEGRRCLVVGAGPCGLRAAIELRLLGAQVVVAEQRTRFTRINQLHIWSWCGEDLKGLGARIIEPPPKDFGANPDLLVIAINDLQKLLLKVALLLGADVRLGLSYNGVQSNAGGWTAELGVGSGTSLGAEGRAGAATPASPLLASFAAPGSLPPSPFAPGSVTGLAAVLGSGGFASAVGDQVGMRMIESESLRRESAIGLICNVARTNGKAEASLRSYSMARQFYTAKFKELAKETGADLENIVYVKAPTAHYFVMTPTPKSLIASGAVIDKTQQPIFVRENIDQEKLEAMVQRVLSYRFKDGEPTLMEAVSKDLGSEGSFPGYADGGPRLFDFSKMRRSSDGLIFLPPPPPGDASAQEGEEGSNLFVALAGDALIEPFWPEGLGIVRGFFSVLDACYALQQWSNGATCAATQEVYRASFQKLKTLSAATRASVLREDESKFALAPCTRYR